MWIKHAATATRLLATTLVLLLCAVPGHAQIFDCKTAPPGAFLGKPNATVLGQATMIAFGSSFRSEQGALPGVEGPWLAPGVTGAVLLALSLLAWLHAPKEAELHYWLVVSYPAATALVEFVRMYLDASRFGFLSASWHNLPEYGLILFNLLDKGTATKLFPLVLLWVWTLDQVIMFIPSLDGVRSGVFWAGLVEQLCGICCDHLLCYTFLYLWWFTPKGPLKSAYQLGLLGSVMHMLEIVPLVVLLTGIVPRPSIPICVLVAFTTPITFYFYNKFALAWHVGAVKETKEKASIAPRPRYILLAVGIALGLTNILAPSLLIPSCTIQEASPVGRPIWTPFVSHITTTPKTTYASKLELEPYAHLATLSHLHPADPAYAGPGQAPSQGGATELMCPSNTILTGTTTLVARPGKVQELRDFVATMPGPIRLEEGCVSYDEGYSEATSTLRFFETWSSIRTLYKHVYLSPTVRNVFGNDGFKALRASQKLEGPFQTMIPCSAAGREPAPMTLPFSTIIDAPIECLWEKINDWSGDISWVKGALGATNLGPMMRILHFKTANLTEIRQAPPLAPVEQPIGGHRLVYYVLDGGLVPSLAEVYRGELTLMPAPNQPTKTLFTYHATVTPKDTTKADQLYKAISSDFNNVRLPFLREWGAALQCNVPGTTEHYYQMKLPSNRPAIATGAEMLAYVTGNKDGVMPKIKYIANMLVRVAPPQILPAPNMTQPWDVVMALEFPPDCAIRPLDLGKGVALEVFHMQVKSKPMPLLEQTANCSAEVLQAAADGASGNAHGLLGVLEGYSKLAAAAEAGAPLPARLGIKNIEDPISSINLLKYKPSFGAACYQLYMLQVYQLLHANWCHLAYYAEVVHDPKVDAAEQWDEILIPVYPSPRAFLAVSGDPSYPAMVGVRAAGLIDSANIGVFALPGSKISID